MQKLKLANTKDQIMNSFLSLNLLFMPYRYFQSIMVWDYCSKKSLVRSVNNKSTLSSDKKTKKCLEGFNLFVTAAKNTL